LSAVLELPAWAGGVEAADPAKLNGGLFLSAKRPTAIEFALQKKIVMCHSRLFPQAQK
jgi:hypothetical protein